MASGLMLVPERFGLSVHRAAVLLRQLNEEDVFFLDVMVFIGELP